MNIDHYFSEVVSGQSHCRGCSSLDASNRIQVRGYQSLLPKTGYIPVRDFVVIGCHNVGICIESVIERLVRLPTILEKVIRNEQVTKPDSHGR
jgi:hypothetical protein